MQYSLRAQALPDDLFRGLIAAYPARLTRMPQSTRGVEFVLGDLLRIAGGDEDEVEGMVC